MKNAVYKMDFERANEKINGIIEECHAFIVDLIKRNDGLIKTPAGSDKPTIYAVYDTQDAPRGTQEVAIHGLRWDEELGLTICTDETLNNYTFDTGCYFSYTYDFEGEDLENLEKALADPAYFVEFDKYDLDQKLTILNLIAGLPAYL